jgi:hypothetical protein
LAELVGGNRIKTLSDISPEGNNTYGSGHSLSPKR